MRVRHIASMCVAISCDACRRIDVVFVDEIAPVEDDPLHDGVLGVNLGFQSELEGCLDGPGHVLDYMYPLALRNRLTLTPRPRNSRGLHS